MFKFKIMTIFALVFLFITESCNDSLNPLSDNLVNNDDTAVITSGPSSLAKAMTVMTRDTINEYWRLWGECLNEDLDIYYSDELIAHTTIDNAGGFHSVMHWRPINTIAYGVESVQGKIETEVFNAVQRWDNRHLRVRT